MTKSFCKIFRFACSIKITPANKISRKVILLKYITLGPSTRALNWFGGNHKRGQHRRSGGVKRSLGISTYKRQTTRGWATIICTGPGAVGPGWEHGLGQKCGGQSTTCPTILLASKATMDITPLASK
jgi:hypothetical protein